MTDEQTDTTTRLWALARAEHERVASGLDGPVGERCPCGHAGPSAPACVALSVLLDERDRLRCWVEALERYDLALFDLEVTTVQRHLRATGWMPARAVDGDEVWEIDDGVHRHALTLGGPTSERRRVDHLRDAVSVLTIVERRSAPEILGALLAAQRRP